MTDVWLCALLLQSKRRGLIAVAAGAGVGGRAVQLRRLVLTFGVAALVVAIAQPVAAGTIIYTYDSDGRLVSVVYSDGTTITYTYDAMGNRTQYVVSP
ncbi:RHS repeat domain-containing protein [Caulobacter sp. KR2-114]|uniref:RHS repeat domain-containing protein n=1 Tax=Caulobacter sp. KR2-114 TaxID=3400912 RepID=UPI003C0661A0